MVIFKTLNNDAFEKSELMEIIIHTTKELNWVLPSNVRS